MEENMYIWSMYFIYVIIIIDKNLGTVGCLPLDIYVNRIETKDNRRAHALSQLHPSRWL